MKNNYLKPICTQTVIEEKRALLVGSYREGGAYGYLPEEVIENGTY